MRHVCFELECTDNVIHYTVFNNIESVIASLGINDFFDYLLLKSREYVLNGNSICQKQIIPTDIKLSYYDNVIKRSNLEETSLEIRKLSSGWKRYYIHSRRFQIDDFDLAFLFFYIKMLLDCYKPNSGQFSFILCFYCAEGIDYSYKLSKKSIPRVNDIIDYLCAMQHQLKD